MKILERVSGFSKRFEVSGLGVLSPIAFGVLESDKLLGPGSEAFGMFLSFAVVKPLRFRVLSETLCNCCTISVLPFTRMNN